MATGVSRDKWRNKLTQTSNLFNSGVDVRLAYEGKRTELEILQTEPAIVRLLWQGAETNRLYYADNLPILSSLLQDSSIRGKVRLIYIDPPFATNSIFQSRSQDDALTAISTTLRRFAKGLEPMGDFVSKQDEKDERPVQQSLLEETERHEETIQATTIKNFSLFAAGNIHDELQDVLEQWLTWQ